MDALERISKMIDGLEMVERRELEEATNCLDYARESMNRARDARREANELKVILVLSEAHEARAAAAAGDTCGDICPCGANPECGCKEEPRHDGG